MNESRKEKAIKNGVIGVICQFIVLLLSFITRKIFLNYLSVDYLGYNGLFSNIIGMLNLAELGIGTALTFKFYEPIAKGDTLTVKRLLVVYKKIYNTIGFLVLAVGTGISPFVPYIIKETSKTNAFIILLFLVQLCGTASTYFLSYRRTIFFAKQRDFVNTLADMVANIIFSILKILSLVFFSNYIIYLALQIAQNYFSNLIISILCKKQYPEYFEKKREEIDKYETKQLTKDVFKQIKEVAFGKFAVYIHSSTDNIILSIFDSLTSIGLLSNYYLFTSTITTFLNKLLDPIQAGLGNKIQVESDSKSKEGTYYVFQFLQCAIGAVVASGIITFINPAIKIFFGEQFLLSDEIVLVIGINLYLDILQRPSCNMINAAGLFKFDKFSSFAGASTNLILSMILVSQWGLIGVLIGTTISQMVFLVFRSSIVLRAYLKISVMRFWCIVFKFTFFLAGFSTVGYFFISNYVQNFFFLCIFAIAWVVVTVTVLLGAFWYNPECKFYVDMVKTALKKGKKYHKGRQHD